MKSTEQILAEIDRQMAFHVENRVHFDGHRGAYDALHDLRTFILSESENKECVHNWMPAYVKNGKVYSKRCFFCGETHEF